MVIEKNLNYGKIKIYNGQPVIMSEYGGIALNSEEGWGYGKQVKDEKEFIENERSLILPAI